MKRTKGGAVQSQNIPFPRTTGSGRKDAFLYRCLVVGVTYTDEENLTKNASNPRVLYDCVVLGGEASGQLLTDCRLSSYLGGNENYDERVLAASTKPLHETRLEDQDGDIVYVLFVQGQTGFPVIIACDNGTSTKDDIGAKKADGARWKTEFNNVVRVIDKDGNVTLSLPGTTAIDSEGNITVTSEEDVTITASGNIKLKLAGTAKVAIGNSTVEVVDVVSQTLQLLSTTTVNTMLGPQPLSTFANFTALKTLLDQIKGSI